MTVSSNEAYMKNMMMPIVFSWFTAQIGYLKAY